MPELGRSDLPLAPGGKDLLGLEIYARALVEFVRSCETPMTIGIQGEWGSGKTSLMNMVRGMLDREKGESPVPVFVHSFETWQYGALADDDALGLQLITNLADEIVRLNPQDGTIVSTGGWLREQAARLGQRLTQPGFTRAVAAGLVGVVPGLDGQEMATAVGNALADAPASRDRGGMPGGLGRLRSTFASVVEAITAGSRRTARPGRLVIFIDDLDRIRPARAVSLLEVLKNFLDVEHCVFVIACDYEVVRLGVEAKFGIREKEKARAFFDKIIQVPFQMPVRRYDVGGLLADYMKGKREGAGRQALNQARELGNALAPMVSIATGANPRTFKRFLNQLDLNSCLYQSRTADSGGAADDRSLDSMWAEPQKVASLVGLVAMQVGWPRVADHLAAQKEAEDVCTLLDRLRGLAAPSLEGGDVDVEIDDLDRLLADEYATEDDEQWREHEEVQALSRFAEGVWFSY